MVGSEKVNSGKADINASSTSVSLGNLVKFSLKFSLCLRSSINHSTSSSSLFLPILTDLVYKQPLNRISSAGWNIGRECLSSNGCGGLDGGAEGHHCDLL